MSWQRSRVLARRDVEVLLDLLSDEAAADSVLIDSYLDARTSLASAFADLAQERYRDNGVLDEAVAMVARALAAVTDVPERYRRVRRFSSSHRILLTFLTANVGRPVSAAKVKMVNAEQTETGRRVRELRTLGYQIDAIHDSGQDHFVLRSELPDASRGARHQIAYQIRNDGGLSNEKRDQVLARFGVADL